MNSNLVPFTCCSNSFTPPSVSHEKKTRLLPQLLPSSWSSCKHCYNGCLLVSFFPPLLLFEHHLKILNKRAFEASEELRHVPDFSVGEIVEIKLEVPKNRCRLFIYKGIVVICKQNAVIHTAFSTRRIIVGVGVEILFLFVEEDWSEMSGNQEARTTGECWCPHHFWWCKYHHG